MIMTAAQGSISFVWGGPVLTLQEEGVFYITMAFARLLSTSTKVLP